MTNRFLLIFILLVGAWWFVQSPKEGRRSEPVETVQKPLEKARTAAPVPQPVRAIQPVAPPVKAAVKVSEKPVLPEEPFAGPMDTVHFKVEDGLAVAFGDLILGKPVTDRPIKDGYNKPPPPERWKERDIPYIIHPDLKNPERIEAALAHLKAKTVVTFVPFNGEKDAVVFEPGTENCKSFLGKVGGHQPIKLADRCGWVEVLHEIMHVFGFVHEQSRTDRDKYVEILWDNVIDEMKPQFAMVPEDLMEPLKDFEFDYHSIMLYPANLFAKRPNEYTLRSKGTQPVDPSAGGLSQEDVERINKLFR